MVGSLANSLRRQRDFMKCPVSITINGGIYQQDVEPRARIGEALRAFNTQWSRRVVRNGPVVLIVSDGWDRGNPALLNQELARVRRGCRRLIWLNPLLGSADYEPLTRGIQAALRHVDDFLPAHNLASLEQLADHLRTLPVRTRPVAWRVRHRSAVWS